MRQRKRKMIYWKLFKAQNPGGCTLGQGSSLEVMWQLLLCSWHLVRMLHTPQTPWDTGKSTSAVAETIKCEWLWGLRVQSSPDPVQQPLDIHPGRGKTTNQSSLFPWLSCSLLLELSRNRMWFLRLSAGCQTGITWGFFSIVSWQTHCLLKIILQIGFFLVLNSLLQLFLNLKHWWFFWFMSLFFSFAVNYLVSVCNFTDALNCLLCCLFQNPYLLQNNILFLSPAVSCCFPCFKNICWFRKGFGNSYNHVIYWN